MQTIAAWLTGRPLNAVLGLVASYILLPPMAAVLSGSVMVLLVLHGGVRRSAIQAILAATVLALVALVAGGSAPAMFAGAAMIWLPAFLLAALLGYWRSLTLTMQVSAILAAAGVLGFYVVLGDPTVFWSRLITEELAVFFRDMGFNEQADSLIENQAIVAQQATVLFVFMVWSSYVFGLLLGYALLQALPTKQSVFGRFCDLNFGRVLALIMAVASVAAVLVGADWLRNLAFLIFVVFWIQGLAILHWLRVEKGLPAILLVTVYVLIPLLNALPVISLAVVGYVDAWFGFRTRGAPRGDNRVE